MVDISDLWTPFYAAKCGDLRLLADHIENGGDLPPTVRTWLADYLRGAISPSKSRRKFSQIKMERDYALLVMSYKMSGMSEYAAMKAVLRQFPHLNEETLKTYWRRWKARK